MSSARALRVYRPQGFSTFLALLVNAIFFLIGLSMVTIGPGQRDGASSAVLGALVLLGSIYLGASVATNRLIATQAGLTYWYFLRRRFIGWPEIQSFGVGPSRGRMRYPCPVIQLNNGSVALSGLASFTAAYPARVAGELNAMQRERSAGSPSGETLLEGESS